MCLVMSLGPRDFHNGAKLTGDLMDERHVDAHHIFPQTYLHRHEVARRLRDCVLNCTLIDRTTNKPLYTRAPADYLAQIRTTLGAEPFRELLQSHVLPSEPDSPLWRNDFEAFLARRQELLWQEIQRVTGLAHAPARTEDHARPPLRVRGGGTRPPVVSIQEGAQGPGARPQALAGLEGYLARQSHHTRRLWQALDRGIRALAPDIATQTTRGRRCVGGVSYYTPERLFFCADFIAVGDGLTLSVFTAGQPWEGLNRARSAPWGYAVIRTEAALPQALAWAKAAYEARKRAP
jgi:hypothetical protein